MAEGDKTDGKFEENMESGDENGEYYDETIENIDDVDGNFESKPKKKLKNKLRGTLTFEATDRISRGSPLDEVYDMGYKKRGKCIIFNHKYFKCGLEDRKGTDNDAKELKKFFEKLKFEVVQHNDKEAAEVLQILSDAQQENHKESSCFVCCVLTHGDFDAYNKQEVLYATDQAYSTDKLFTPFLGDKCKDLAGKPKLFFIQACRGDKADNGLLTFFNFFKIQAMFAQQMLPVSDAVEKDPLVSFKIPVHSDFLIACSTVSGYMAWKRRDVGSWFIQSLCETLKERSTELDLLSILTIVCRKVAYCYESRSLECDMSQKKQVPSIYSTLTKQFRFHTISSNDNKNT